VVTSALSDGTIYAGLRATDVAGNTSSYTSTSFVIDTTAPEAPVVTAPEASASVTDTTPTVTGAAEAGAAIAVSVAGTASGGSTTVAADGSWSVDLDPALEAGSSYTLSATATDQTNNTSAATEVAFTVAAAATDEASESTTATEATTSSTDEVTTNAVEQDSEAGTEISVGTTSAPQTISKSVTPKQNITLASKGNPSKVVTKSGSPAVRMFAQSDFSVSAKPTKDLEVTDAVLRLLEQDVESAASLFIGTVLAAGETLVSELSMARQDDGTYQHENRSFIKYTEKHVRLDPGVLPQFHHVPPAINMMRYE